MTATAPRLGLGLMGMSGMYGRTDDAESLATITAALDHGLTFLDTGDFYGMGHNELLLGRAFQGRRRDQVTVSVKFGALRTPAGEWTGLDLRPAAIKNFLSYSLVRLGLDYIDIYRPARFSPALGIPIEEVIGTLADLVRAGYIRHIGLSEVGPATIRRAAAVHPIADLQIEYSLLSRSIEDEILPTLRELGIAVTAYGVLSRGLLSGSRPAGPNDFRAHLPRFAASNAEQNRHLIQRFHQFAHTLGATPTQLAIAWVLAADPTILTLIGARTRPQLRESLAAVSLVLTPAQHAELATLFPPGEIAGTRYDSHQMAMLDSEQSTKANT